MNLYTLTLAAHQNVQTYRSPDIEEWCAAIDPVLSAAGQALIGNDHVEDITLSKHDLCITTSYSARNCTQINDIRIPLSIIQSENPVQAATCYQIETALSEAKDRMAVAQRSVVEYSKKVATLEAELVACTARGFAPGQ